MRTIMEYAKATETVDTDSVHQTSLLMSDNSPDRWPRIVPLAAHRMSWSDFVARTSVH